MMYMRLTRNRRQGGATQQHKLQRRQRQDQGREGAIDDTSIIALIDETERNY
jgi:hypothetical protein